AARVRTLHAAFFRGLAETAEPHLTGPESGKWLARLTAEVPNLRAALRWGLDSGDLAPLETALLTAGALWRYWQLTGVLREAAEWFAQLLGREGEGGLPDAGVAAGRAKALQGAGGIAYWQDDLIRSRQL